MTLALLGKGMSVSRVNNQLILGLSASDRTLLSARLTPVELELRQVLEFADAGIGNAYFPESGAISVLAGAGTHQLEVGLIGREGMTGIPVVLGNHSSPQEALVQVAGSAWRLSADHLRECMDASAAIRRRFMRYAQVFLVQIAHTAIAGGN